MKKLLISIVTLFLIYTFYYDLSNGTLPASNTKPDLKIEKKAPENDKVQSETRDQPKQNNGDLTYEVIKVTPGSTVLSIVEHLHNGPIPVSIPQLVKDFETLNPEIKPEKIQIGKEYKFPIYIIDNLPE